MVALQKLLPRILLPLDGLLRLLPEAVRVVYTSFKSFSRRDAAYALKNVVGLASNVQRVWWPRYARNYTVFVSWNRLVATISSSELEVKLFKLIKLVIICLTLQALGFRSNDDLIRLMISAIHFLDV